jgi:WD40 repeat protein
MSRILALSALACLAAGARPAHAQEPPPAVRLGTVDSRTVGPYWVALSRDGKQLAYRTGPDTLGLFDPLTGKLARTLSVTEKEVGEQLFFTPDCKHLVFHAMQSVRLMDPVTGKVTPVAGGGNQFDVYPHTFVWSADGMTLASSSHRYDFGHVPPLRFWDGAGRKVTGEAAGGPSGSDRAHAMSGDGKVAATGSTYHKKQDDKDEAREEYVTLWDVAARKAKTRIHLGPMNCAVSLALNADGRYLVVATHAEDGVQLWDTVAGKKVAGLGRLPGGQPWYTFSPDDTKFAIQTGSGYTAVFETATGKKVADRQDRGTKGAGVGFTADGDVLACFVDGTHVRVSSLTRKGQPSAAAPVGHAARVLLTRFSDDGETVLTVGGDMKVLRWDARTGKLLETVVEQAPRPGTWWNDPCQFSPDGKFLVVGVVTQPCLFDLAGKKEVGTLAIRSEKYWAQWAGVDFSEDGKTVFARGTGQERRKNDFKIVTVGYAAAWGTADAALRSESGGGRGEGTDAVFERNYGKEKLAVAKPVPNLPEVAVGAGVRDPWASSMNAGPLTVGNLLTVRDRESKKVLVKRVLNLNGGRGIGFSPDGKRVALPMADNTVLILDLPDAK